MSGNRRTLLLLALLLVAGGYYGWTLVSDGVGGPGRVGLGGSGARLARGGPSAEIEALATDRLAHKPSVYRQGRDLFTYGQPPRPAAPPRPPAPPSPPPKPVEETQPRVTQPPRPQPPPVDVVYLGSFGHPGRRIAVFSDDEAVYNARVGDVIKDKFILVTIGYESADLGFVGFPEASPRRLAVGRVR